MEIVSVSSPTGPSRRAADGEQTALGRGAATRPSGSRDEEARRLRGPLAFTAEEERELEDLRRRDREVRAHERAHLAAAGRHAAGGAQFTYRTGPDGRRYAVDGEVRIDASPIVGEPEATAQKMRQVRTAALAPSDPSVKDRQVAAEAARQEAAARVEAREAQGEPVSHGGALPCQPCGLARYAAAADRSPAPRIAESA